MPNDTEYNGWTNYETWLVNLWLDNDQGSYEYVREQAQEILENSKPTNDFGIFMSSEDNAKREMSDWLKDDVEQQIYGNEVSACLASDLLGAALSEVNWREIAEHYLEDCEDA